MKIIQYAKFALLYEKQSAVIAGDHDDPDYVGETQVESNLNQPAIVDLGGIRLHSDIPTTAAQAARINERLKEVVC